MKKLFYMLALLLIMLIPVAALAEGELPTNPFTWEQLATIAGCTLATLLIVELIKLPLDKVWKIPTRIVVYIIALILLLMATYFTSGMSVETALLTLINAVIVALAAFGAYEVTFRKLEEKKKAATEAVTEEQKP